MEKIAEANDAIKVAFETYELDYKTEIGKLDLEERKLADRFKKLDNMKREVAETIGDADVSKDDLIEINAGGKIIVVLRSVLTQFTGTRLEALFSGHWDKKLRRDSARHIFLDVNSVCFQAIVDYLNEVTISTEENPAAPPHVDAEYQNILTCQLELFGLWDLLPLVLPDSKIIQNAGHAKLLRNWLSEDIYNGYLTLLYRSSRDGRCDATFHQKCDKKGATITVIETIEGYIIGGYTDLPWTKGTGYGCTDSSKAFLFTISKLDDGATSKLTIAQNYQCAIYNHPSSGPTFGSGFDLQVNGAYLCLKTGNTYHPALNNLKGNHTFTIKEMEVFQVTSKSSSKECTRQKPNKFEKHASKTSDIHTGKHNTSSKGKVQCFTHAINTAINRKWAILKDVESDISLLEDSFTDETKFIKFFSSGKDQDIISLNVCGTIMNTTRQTLDIVKDSVLASKILNANQDARSINQKLIQEWNTEDVVAWLNKIDGLSHSTVKSFENEEVTGRELLALGKEGLMDFGITKRGTIYYILAEIKKLSSAQEQNVVFIEHSPYCFEKIIDHLRLENMFVKGLSDQKPKAPTVQASEKSRFEKVVKHYFTGDCSNMFLEN
ncbi:hypothetical protein ACHAWX_004918 [Stephanocyclus meneghinianus]